MSPVRAIAVGLVAVLVLLPPLANAGYSDDAYLVSGGHAIYGAVSGYLQLLLGDFAELWLSGESLVYFWAKFTLRCDVHAAADVVVDECAGYQTSQFVGAYPVDAKGDALGPATGYGTMYGFQLVATGHT